MRIFHIKSTNPDARIALIDEHILAMYESFEDGVFKETQIVMRSDVGSLPAALYSSNRAHEIIQAIASGVEI